MTKSKVQKATFKTTKFSVTNYAKHIGVSRTAVYRRLKKGIIQRVYIDGKPFIYHIEQVDNV